jgi:hypothetical protein
MSLGIRIWGDRCTCKSPTGPVSQREKFGGRVAVESDRFLAVDMHSCLQTLFRHGGVGPMAREVYRDIDVTGCQRCFEVNK